MFGKIRIIGGKWKGRTVFVGNQSKVRPTTSRMRETLFNWLNPIIVGTVCLDCFAGSGVLGLESLSRGAKRVTFIDQNRICTMMLIQIIKKFGVYSCGNIVIHGDCCVWLKKKIGMYDIVFIDPPFHRDVILVVIRLLERYNHLKKNAWVYIETFNSNNMLDVTMLPCHWVLYRSKVTRNVAYYLYLIKR